MSKETRDFDIHGLVRLRIDGGMNRGALQGLAYPYSHFRTEEAEEPDITVRIGHFTLQERRSEVVDQRFRVAYDYFAAEDQMRGVSFRLEISGMENPPILVRFMATCRGSVRLVPEYAAHAVVIKPLVEYLIYRQGGIVTHCAGIAKNGTGVILFGRGGTHKTTLTMRLVRDHGFEYLGDDSVILGNGDALSYPYLADLFDFRIRHLQTEQISRTGKALLLLHLLRLCHRSPAEWQVAGRARPAIVCELVKSTNDDVNVASLDCETAAKRMTICNQLEHYGDGRDGFTLQSPAFGRFMSAYLFGTPTSRWHSYWKDTEDRLIRGLRQVRLMRLSLPLTFSPSIEDRVLSLLDGFDSQEGGS